MFGRCVEGHGLVGILVIGGQLDWMILEGFSNLGDSTILSVEKTCSFSGIVRNSQKSLWDCLMKKKKWQPLTIAVTFSNCYPSKALALSRLCTSVQEQSWILPRSMAGTGIAAALESPGCFAHMVWNAEENYSSEFANGWVQGHICHLGVWHGGRHESNANSWI